MLSFNSAVTYGAAGSPYGSELLFSLPVGPFYLSQSSVAQLATVLPTWAWITIGTATQAVDVQYSPDTGTTWRSARAGTSTLLYIDSGGTIRLFNSAAGTANVFLVPIRQGRV